MQSSQDAQNVMNTRIEPANITWQEELPTSFRMRCPSCRKLYSLQRTQLSQHTKFNCTGCSAQFGVIPPQDLYTDTLDTFIREPAAQEPVVRAPILDRSCPKCGYKVARTAPDCGACGVVFAKYRTGDEERVAGEIQFAGKRELVSLWEEVIADYENETVHDRFILACFEAGCLPFASHKYARVLTAAPDEEIAKKMRKRIVALASHKMEFQGAKGGWKFRIPGFNGLAILLGSTVMFTGFFLSKFGASASGLGNLTGIGASMLALSLGVRFFVLGRPE